MKNKIKYYLKNIGWLMLSLGILSIPFQCFYPQIFPYNSIFMLVSIVFQLIGWNEPFFFMKNKNKSMLSRWVERVPMPSK